MNVFREKPPGSSAVHEYLDKKRQEFIGAAGPEFGAVDALRLGEGITGLGDRIEQQLASAGKAAVCYLVVGRVQSGKTGHQLGMLSWAADRCDVAVIFTGVTEALNGQTSHRIKTDLGTLPSAPVKTIVVPTRAAAEANPAFKEDLVKRTAQRQEYLAGAGVFSEPLPILIAMKTKPRVDALQWLFTEVAKELGEGVTALIIDDEADQASPNAAARKMEEAATYAQLKALRKASARHVWLSYTATPQAVFLTQEEGALRPDFCAVSQPGSGYFGVTDLMAPLQKAGRVEIGDWPKKPKEDQVPHSLTRALADLLTASWLRVRDPEAFYRPADGNHREGLRSVQMLIHTSSKTKDHERDYKLVEVGLNQIKEQIKDALQAQDPSKAPVAVDTSWNWLAKRVHTATGGMKSLPDLRLEQLQQLGDLISRIERRVVNSAASRPTAEAGALPTDRSGWEAHPAWIIIGGDILGRGLTIPQLVTTYFTRSPQKANEDTVAQQMRFCGYRTSYSHVVVVHALADIFTWFEELARIERVLISTAEEWEDADENLKLDSPALWYVRRPSARLQPTRLQVRDRNLVDINKGRQILSLRQFVQPASFQHNAKLAVAWLGQHAANSDEVGGWVRAECGADDVRALLQGLRLAGRDIRDAEVARELMSKRLGDLGLADLPFVAFLRETDRLTSAAASNPPRIDDLPTRRLRDDPGATAPTVWRDGWKAIKRVMQPEQWYDTAVLGVQHVGAGQRKPLEELGYDAVGVIIEPIAVHFRDEKDHLGAGLALSILAPEDFEVCAVGASDSDGD